MSSEASNSMTCPNWSSLRTAGSSRIKVPLSASDGIVEQHQAVSGGDPGKRFQVRKHVAVTGSDAVLGHKLIEGGERPAGAVPQENHLSDPQLLAEPVHSGPQRTTFSSRV